MKIEPAIIEGHTWHIGGNIIRHRRGAYVILPIDQIGDLSDAELGAHARSLVERARLTQAEDDATWIKNNWSTLPTTAIQKSITAIEPFAAQSDAIRHICASLRAHIARGHQPKQASLLRQPRDAGGPGWIYIIYGETGHYKIGRTAELPQRIVDIMLVLPFRIDLYHAIPTNNMRWAEYHLHERFAAKRIRGEWFRLNSHDLDWLVALDRLDEERDDA